MVQRLLVESERRNLEVVRKTAHSLKSAAGALGARRLSILCSILETGILHGKDLDIEKSCREIQCVYLMTCDAIGKALTRSS